MVLGFSPGVFLRGALNTTINLLQYYPDGCKANCSYCGQAREVSQGPDCKTLIRVEWPLRRLDDVLRRIKERQGDPRLGLQGICVGELAHPRTHTVYRSILWGLLLSLPIGVLYFVFPSFLFVFSVILDGLLVGPSHMILDVFTERGIYHKVNGKWRRIAFAHFSYNNPLANGLVILLGILMLFAAMELHTYHYYYHYYHYYNYYS